MNKTLVIQCQYHHVILGDQMVNLFSICYIQLLWHEIFTNFARKFPFVKLEL